MLINNSFFFISLPRCASTSFFASCVKQNINIKHFSEKHNIINQLKNKKIIDYSNFQYELNHIHEPLNLLRNKFGDHYEVISVKRNKYERFISLWKHVLHEMSLKEHSETYEKCLKMGLDDILFYRSFEISDDIKIFDLVNLFISINKLDKITDTGKNMISILFKPYSGYHHHDKNIIWFDFNNLNKLENWVSEKISMDFKLIKINSSQHVNCNLILDEKFKIKYDSIYEIYDEIKGETSII